MDKLELKILGSNYLTNDWYDELDALKNYSFKTCLTDLCILTGCDPLPNTYNLAKNGSDRLRNRVGYIWTSSNATISSRFKTQSGVYVCSDADDKKVAEVSSRQYGIRPAIQNKELFDFLVPSSSVTEVIFGEYPQYAPPSRIQKLLDEEYDYLNAGDQTSLKETDKSFTFDFTSSSTKRDNDFEPVPIYEYEGRKYIRLLPNFSNGSVPISGIGDVYCADEIWFEIQPIKWLVDHKTKILLSKYALVSGVKYTDIDVFLNKFMLPEILECAEIDLKNLENSFAKTVSGSTHKKLNPYNLNLKPVSEEDIIRGAIQSNVAVFLHGLSSDGKSARVKQIDPDCQTIYLCNSTPESLNGKSVYNQEKNQMIDLPPTWYVKLKERCEAEPDKLHVVFFDEITNARPSIQGDVFNIVLDKIVNGMWELPENARVVAAGNEMEDSLAANQIAEPLYNRFAHVYIKTTVENWLEWASKNNIHPAIYAYIAFAGDDALRTEYTGEKPNADPRKWEMASDMLYQTGSPEMLRALVGEEITKEFVEFCNGGIITLEDVINDYYTDDDIKSLNTAERFATTSGLSAVDSNNLEKVRNFVKKMEPELVTVFDNLWIHGDPERLAELDLLRKQENDLTSQKFSSKVRDYKKFLGTVEAEMIKRY